MEGVFKFIMKSMRYLYNVTYHGKDKWKSSKYVPLYGVFSRSGGPYGPIIGYIENSFSMGWSNTSVRLWDLWNAEHYLKELKKKYPEADIFIYRLTRKSPNAMITAQLSERTKKLMSGHDKRSFRNCPFVVNKI